jgi:predicted nuclease of restriction endonuclease-like (RecB) superfamily
MAKTRKPPTSSTPAPADWTFDRLVGSIRDVDADLKHQAARAVNVALTLRNWLIGAHIAEYELRGQDRAAYGEKWLDTLAQELARLAVTGCGRRQLYQYLRFFRLYPQIVRSLTAQFQLIQPKWLAPILDATSATVSAPSAIPSETILHRLSYTHIEQLIALDDAKRAFYEAECLRGGWSVRELKRQIASLYYERTALSHNKAKLVDMTHAKAESAAPRLDVRDPYIFEFLGLQSREVMGESHLEDQLLDRLQDFLLELGHGFCFEARQKRILIGDTHGFVDLVFYHRILKCHILIELKLEGFSHENIGQLNTYVSWYDRNVRTDNDGPPIGILLCAEKDQTLVEYALAGMDNHLFVSKYQLHLPDRESLKRELERSLQDC